MFSAPNGVLRVRLYKCRMKTFVLGNRMLTKPRFEKMGLWKFGNHLGKSPEVIGMRVRENNVVERDRTRCR